MHFHRATGMPAPSMTTRLVFLLAVLTAFGPLSIDMYLPAFPAMTAELNTDQGALEFTLAAYLVSAGLCQMLYGPLSDRFGRRPPLFFGCAFFAVAAFACARATSVGSLTAARFLQGFGSAAGVVVARAVVRDMSEPQEAARVFSQLMLIMGIAPILAPWVGGQILLFSGWRGIFILLTAFGGLTLAASYFILPETLPAARRVRGGFGIAFRNYGALLSDRRFMGFSLAAGFISGTLFSYIAGASFVFIELYGITPQRFGYLFGLNAVGLVAASQINRLLLRRFPAEAILSWAMKGNALAASALALFGYTGWGGLYPLAIFLFIALFHVGLTYPNIPAVALAPYGSLAGSASALLGAFQFLIGGAGGALVGVFFNGTAFPMTACMAACSIVGWILHLVLTEGTPGVRQKQTGRESDAPPPQEIGPL